MIMVFKVLHKFAHSSKLFVSKSVRTFSKLTKLRMSSSTNFKKITDNIYIDGSCDTSAVNYIGEISKSVIYLCPDANGDSGAPNGFDSFKTIFQDSSYHIPFDPAVLTSQNDPSEKVKLSLELYHKLDLALKTAAHPVSIVCKSNARASAVYAAYQAIQDKKSVVETTEASTALGLNYLSKSPLVDWVNTVITYTHEYPQNHSLLLRQLFESESSTYTYLLADETTKDAILIDPVLETVDRDASLIRELNLNLKYMLNTHVHADHITGTGALKLLFPDAKSVIASMSGATADIQLSEFTPIVFGHRHVYAYHTPGHTAGCYSYVVDDQSIVFTGDALLIGGCGRTDFQGGSAETLYKSVHGKIFKLSDSAIVYPAHDYKQQTQSTVYTEKTTNPRLTKPLSEFIDIMHNLNLPYPKKIDASLPRNLKCGYE